MEENNIDENNKQDSKMTINNENKMREIEIEKLVLNCGGTEDKLEKSIKLLEPSLNTAETSAF